MAKGGTEKQRASAQEIELARLGVIKDARFEQAFRPLEKAAINELKTADKSKRDAMLAGRASADVNQQARGFDRAAVAKNKGGVMANVDQNTTIGQAGAVARSDARRTARDSLDADTLNVIRTGQGVNRSASSALTTSARLANSRAANILQNKQREGFAKGSALGKVATAAVAGHFAANDNATEYEESVVDAATTGSNIIDRPKGFYTNYLLKRRGF